MHLSLVGPPKANWSWVMGQTKCDSVNSYGYKDTKNLISLAQTRVTGAPPWSQAWGRG